MYILHAGLYTTYFYLNFGSKFLFSVHICMYIHVHVCIDAIIITWNSFFVLSLSYVLRARLTEAYNMYVYVFK